MKEHLKQLIKKIPFAFTQNQKYDRDTKLVIKRACSDRSNCIDIGCHKGEILDIFLQSSPNGRHFAFEPIPELFNALEQKYAKQVTLNKVALSDSTGNTTFNYVVSNPAYSGIKKRKYDRPTEVDTEIIVEKDTLDNRIPENIKIDFIKIDVEGGEFPILQGAKKLLQRSKPIIIFEHGLGGSDFYGTTPQDVFNFFQNAGYQISTMNKWLKGAHCFNLQEFEDQFYKKLNYYFIAFPAI